MKKRLKKILIILLIFIAVIFGAMLLIPVIFKDQILAKVKEVVNENVNAKVTFTDFNLSLLRSFPNLCASMDSLTVVGVDTFALDTLVAFKRFDADVDLWSAISGDAIELERIVLDEPNIHIRVLEDGTANWDIAKETEAPQDTTTETDTTSSGFKLSLKEFRIIKGNIVYDDKDLQMTTRIENMNYTLSGDFTETFTALENNMNIEKLTFAYEDIEYLSNIRTEWIATVDADLEKFEFTMKENVLRLNELELGFDGTVKMPDADIATDLTYKLKKAEFKSLLSLIPVVYQKDFEGMQASGELQFNGFVRGVYSDSTASMPLFGIDLLVEKARFQYPDLPKSADNINIKVKVESIDETGENMDIDISTFHVELAGNPFDARMMLAMRGEEIGMNGAINGTIDFSGLEDVVPLDSMKLKGLMTTALQFNGKLSSLENERYEEFKASGDMKLTGFQYSDPDFPQGLLISKASLGFTPQFVELASFDAKIGKSDFSMQGKVENYMAYIFKDKLLQGNLNFSSGLLDLNEFLTESDSEAENELASDASTEEAPPAAGDTTVSAAFKVPKNIRFTLQTKVKKVLYEKMEITDVVGIVKLMEGKLLLDGLNMNMLGGGMELSGSYDTQDPEKPIANFDFKINSFDLRQTFTAFNTVQRLAPIAENCKGNISVGLNLQTILDENLYPVLNSIDASGRLRSDNIGIEDAPIFGKLADRLKSNKLRRTNLRNIDLSFLMSNGELTLQPTQFKMLGNDAEIQGTQNIDQSIRYVLSWKMDANRAKSIIEKYAKTQTPQGKVDVGIVIGGTLTNPEIEKISSDAADAVKEQVKEKIKEKTDELKQKAGERAQKILDDAEKQAQKIMDDAEKEANKIEKQLMDEADKQGQKLIEQASNPLTKAAAKKTAEKLKEKAKEKAARQKQRILNRAEEKANLIRKNAQKRAGRLQ